jgi:hypothetical protein
LNFPFCSPVQHSNSISSLQMSKVGATRDPKIA